MYRKTVLAVVGLAMACMNAGPALAGNELEGSEWGYAGRDEPFVRFETDNRIVGHGGCNSFFGSWRVEETGKISIGPLAGTRMACPDDVMQQEFEFMQALEKATGYRIIENRLELEVDGLTWTEMERRDRD